MKLYDVVQNTPEWHKARLGKATASAFDKIITAVKGDPSKQMEGYAEQLAAEILTGDPTDDFKGNAWTERGHELEPDAIAAYQMLRENAEVEHGQFCSNDEETYGASPDNFVKIAQYADVEVIEPAVDSTGRHIEVKRIETQLVGYDEGLLEIKCFMPKNQIRILRKPEVEREHWPQLQGQLLVTGRKWVDIMFYHPKLKPQIIRVERDDDYIAKLQIALDALVLLVKQIVAEYNGETTQVKEAA